jgi:hypothetical protein
VFTFAGAVIFSATFAVVWFALVYAVGAAFDD